MRVVAIIQARMGSTRLPGKVLMDLGGEPMLSRVVNRTLRAETIDQVVVATTVRPMDNAVERLCLKHGWSVFKGDEDDVLDRYYHAALAYKAAVVVRLTSDCPLIDPEIVNRVVQEFLNLQGEVEPTGLAKVTRAYNLPARYVIHTVGPIVKGKLTELNITDLRNSYLSCLESSKKLKGIRSIAFCSISTGLHGFPFEEAAKIAIDTVNTWFAENPNGLDYVVFNIFKDAEKIIYERLARS